MTRHRLVVATIAAAFTLAGCDLIGGAGSSADTQMTNVEIQPGTASDEMITLDAASGDGTAIDTSTAIAPPVPGEEASDTEAADDAAADPDTPVASDDADTDARPGDVVIRPPGGRAEGDAPAKK